MKNSKFLIVETSVYRKVSIGFLLLCFLTAGCSKLDKLTQFNMDYEATVVVPSTTGLNTPLILGSPEIESNAESEFAVNDTRKDLVEDIRLKRMDLTITSPSGGDFGFLKSVNIFISADNLPELKLAWKDDIPEEAGSMISLDVSDENVEEYIKKDKFQLKVSSVTDEFITQDYKIDVNSVFHVDAKVLGI